jgi:NitT/TauT family transport system substrate-binding protein
MVHGKGFPKEDTVTATRPSTLRRRTLARRTVVSVAAAGLAFGLVACGGSAEDADPKSFKVALIEPDLTTVPIMAAIETMKGNGYTIEQVSLAEPELAIEGLAKGDYQISAEATSPALIANQQGAPIKVIADVVANQWGFYGQEGITTCDDLVGKPVGIFSEGAVATAMVRQWVSANCTAGEPEYLVIGGSDVRAQALQQGEIVATALELSDVAALADRGTPLPPPIVDFSTELRNVHPQTVYANADFLSGNAEAAQSFVDALAAEHKKINEDPAYLVSLVEKFLPESVSDSLPSTAASYVEKGLFDATALDADNMQATIDFFVRAGVIEEGLTVEQAADLKFSDQAKNA